MKKYEKGSFIVYIGKQKSSYQTLGGCCYLFKRNEVYPEKIPDYYIENLFVDLPGQFRMATHNEVRNTENKIAGIIKNPIGRRKGSKNRRFIQNELSTAS